MFSDRFQSPCFRLIIFGICLLSMLVSPVALAASNPSTSPPACSSMDWTNCSCTITFNKPSISKNPTYNVTYTATLSYFPRPQEANLNLINNFFHREYESRICNIFSKLGRSDGYDALLVKGDRLILYSNEKKQDIGIFIPELYQTLKAIAHQPFALTILLGKQQFTGNIGVDLNKHLEKQKTLLANLASSLTTEFSQAKIYDTNKGIVIDAELRAKAKTIATNLLNTTQTYVNKLIVDKAINKDGLIAFKADILPKIIEAANICAAVQLTTINAKVKSAIAMRGSNNNKLYVVIGGGAQSNFREINLQYFSKVFNEIPGYDHFLEDRIIYAEGKFKEIDLLSTLARHILDWEAADALFRDPNRLQRDLLGDSATTWLWNNQKDIPRLTP